MPLREKERWGITLGHVLVRRLPVVRIMWERSCKSLLTSSRFKLRWMIWGCRVGGART